ncbi:sulfatase-like hydrolase/transferase [Marinomonas sp.]|nr:sulfatase-like hydrolase/transferase [Marinomonas sp.]MDB4837922.1 sulfatase-like hydrolase/transferase [Marinomonas sp.]
MNHFQKSRCATNIRYFKCLLAASMVFSSITSNAEQSNVEQVSTESPNFLLIIADDLGVDALGSYGISKSTAHTPNLDALAKSGVSFDNFWATPACTTTRGAIISGQHGYRSTIDYVPAVMPSDTKTLQQRLKLADLKQAYVAGIFGKWHLGGRNPALNHPSEFGVDTYAGNLFNLEDYETWTLTTNGQQSQETGYHTTVVTDLAIDFIQSNTSGPWFTWVAYSAPHAPFHEPPSNLISSDTSTKRSTDKYKAMIEAMDTEIGRLIDALPTEDKDNTYIVFMGDNGTPKRMRDQQIFDKEHVKGSLYEGGIRTPLIIAGAGVDRQGERDSALVNVTDFFATFTTLALGYESTEDVPSNSISFASLLNNELQQETSSLREYNYSEWRTRKTDIAWTVRNADYKVMQHHDGKVTLFASDDLNETTVLENQLLEDELLSIGKSIRSGQYY